MTVPAGARSGPRPPGPSPFARLALTHALSTGGEAFLTVALAGTFFFTVSPAAARPKVALYLALTLAPFAVVAPVIGPLLDRSRGGRRLFVVVTCVTRAALALLMARHIRHLYLYPEAFGVLVLSKGYVVAKSALVPAVVDDERSLVEANARLSLIAVVGGFAGGAPAAGVLQLLGAAWVLRLAALVYLAAGLSAMRLPRAVPRPAAPTEMERAELHASSVLLAATAMAVLRAGVGFTVFLLAFALKRSHEPAWFYGLVIGSSATGGFLGAVGAPPLRRRIPEEAILVLSLLVPGVIALFAARDFGRPMALTVALAVGTGAAAGRLAFDSLVQRDAPDADRGRAFARFETRFQLAWVVGSLLPVVFDRWLEPRVGLLVLALALGFAGLSYLGGMRAARLAHHTPPNPPHPHRLSGRSPRHRLWK